jgi:hypothetical protein
MAMQKTLFIDEVHIKTSIYREKSHESIVKIGWKGKASIAMFLSQPRPRAGLQQTIWQNRDPSGIIYRQGNHIITVTTIRILSPNKLRTSKLKIRDPQPALFFVHFAIRSSHGFPQPITRGAALPRCACGRSNLRWRQSPSQANRPTCLTTPEFSALSRERFHQKFQVGIQGGQSHTMMQNNAKSSINLLEIDTNCHLWRQLIYHHDRERARPIWVYFHVLHQLDTLTGHRLAPLD